MKFKNYTLAELNKLVDSGNLLNNSVVPITPLRVKSQQKNPKAKPNDKVLTIAFSEENEILGYIGALPDTVNEIRCAWNSCWWVKPETGAGVSMKLFMIFLSNWEQKVLFSDMTPITVSIIQKLNFCSHKTTNGFRGYYRFALAEVLPRKKSIFKKLKKALTISDCIMNFALNSREIFSPKTTFTEIKLETTHLLNADDDAFICQHNIKQPAKRIANDFNWIIQNPWIATKGKIYESLDNSYYFSYGVERFETKWIRFFKQKKLIALVNFTIKNNELKLPYVFCQSNAAEYVVTYCMQKLKKDKKLAIITIFDQAIVASIRNRKGFVFKTALPKYSAVSNELLSKADLSNFEIQMGDGDCVFT